MNYDHPSHYNQGSVECIDAISSALSPDELSGFIKGNVIKYLWRNNHKNGIEDLKKSPVVSHLVHQQIRKYQLRRKS